MKKSIKILLRESLNKIPILNDEFYKWFEGSQIVDDNGNPLICYHGSNKNIKQFNSKLSVQGVFWFSSNKNKILSGDAGASSINELISVFISGKKVAGWSEYEKLGLGQIEEMGFDVIKLDDDYVVFNPRKIKSINNTGTWDINNKNINK